MIPSPATSLSRQESLQTLPRFSADLTEAIRQSGLGNDDMKQLLQTSVSGQCSQCGIIVTGEDLLAIIGTPDSQAADARILRLRDGYCARNGCDSHYYQVTFRPASGIDWATILPKVEAGIENSRNAAATGTGSAEAPKRFERRRWTARVLLGVALVAILLLIRHWYAGGTIPFVREPENFKVDHAVP